MIKCSPLEGRLGGCGRVLVWSGSRLNWTNIGQIFVLLNLKTIQSLYVENILSSRHHDIWSKINSTWKRFRFQYCTGVETSASLNTSYVCDALCTIITQRRIFLKNAINSPILHNNSLCSLTSILEELIEICLLPKN